MRLKYDAEVTGEISVSEGEVQFSLEDYFGWIPQSPIQWIGEKYDSWSVHGNHDFQGILKSGDYRFMWVTKAEKVDVQLKYKVIYHIPSFEKLVNVGLALIEVSLPLLVTGIVLASCREACAYTI